MGLETKSIVTKRVPSGEAVHRARLRRKLFAMRYLATNTRLTAKLSSGGRAVSRNVTKNQDRPRRLLQRLVRRAFATR